MDLIDDALNAVKVKDRYFCEGNHDQWLNFFANDNPYDGFSLSGGGGGKGFTGLGP